LLALVLTASIVAQPARLFLIALVCKIFKVPAEKVADLTLSEARKGHSAPVRDGIAAALSAFVAAAYGNERAGGDEDENG
jgi:hypothetical protein